MSIDGEAFRMHERYKRGEVSPVEVARAQFGAIDIYKMSADGMAIEHWDTLQIVGGPKNSAPLVAPNIPRANPNGMF
jgi:predicted SnoaL-like aldol condensation-catalyzing enzyme